MLQTKRIALIPAYKPSRLLAGLIRELKEMEFEVIVVDDGSGVEYQGIFAECSAEAVLLRHTENRGKGAALKTGLVYIAEQFGEEAVIVTVDADGQHRPADAESIGRLAEENPESLILGSRRLKGNVPLRSQLGNTITRLIYRISTGRKVHDTQTGLRAFSGQLIPKLLSIPGERYEYEMNVLLLFAGEGIPIREHEIATIYLDNNSQSHFDTLKDSARIYGEILKFSASSLAGFLTDYCVYSALILSTGNLRLSNIVARVVSAGVNFTLNRRFVFNSKEKLLPAAGKYFLLAAGILLGNTIVLEFLVNTLGINRLGAKVLTEILFFAISWLVQKWIVFKKNEPAYSAAGLIPIKAESGK